MSIFKKIFESKKNREEELKPFLSFCAAQWPSFSFKLSSKKSREFEKIEDKIILAKDRNEYLMHWSEKLSELAKDLEEYRIDSEKKCKSLEYCAVIPPGHWGTGLPSGDRVYNFIYEVEKLQSQTQGIKMGISGEKKIEETLAAYRNRYGVISNLVLINAGQSTEIDTIVISNKAVFVLETKNRGDGSYNRQLKITKDGLWKVKTKHDWEIWDSPVEQNIRHKIVLEERLKELLDVEELDFEIVPIIVFANDDIQIENETNNIVIRKSELVNYIEMYKGSSKITKDQKSKLINLLNEHNDINKKMVKVPNYEEIYEYGMSLYQMMDEAVEFCKTFNDKYLKEYKK